MKTPKPQAGKQKQPSKPKTLASKAVTKPTSSSTTKPKQKVASSAASLSPSVAPVQQDALPPVVRDSTAIGVDRPGTIPQAKDCGPAFKQLTKADLGYNPQQQSSLNDRLGQNSYSEGVSYTPTKKKGSGWEIVLLIVLAAIVLYFLARMFGS